MNSTSNVYIPPSTFRDLGYVVDFPRREYSRNFAKFITSSLDNSDHKSYRAGLLFVACLLTGTLFIWCFFLLLFKVNSDSVGCAAGKQFEKKESSAIANNRNKTIKKKKLKESDERSCNTSDLNNSALPAGFSTSHSSEIGATVSMNEPSTIDAREDGRDVISYSVGMGKLEQSTRICFFLFGLFILCAIPLIFVFSYKPIDNAKDDSMVYVDSTKTIIRELNMSITKIISAKRSSMALITNASLTYHDICPKSSPDDIKDQLGIDISGMIDTFNTTYRRLSKTNVTDLRRITSYLDEIVVFTESKYDEADNYFWVIPTFLIFLGAITCTALFGATLAWKRTSTRQMQGWLSYWLLPLLLISSFCCWIIAAGLAVATAIGNDACLGENSTGQPNDTIAEIMELSGLPTNSTIYQAFNSYIEGCSVEDPAQAIAAVADQVDAVSALIWKYLSTIDAIGDSNVAQFCGGPSAFKAFLVAARELAQYLTNAKDGLDSATNALSCKRINTIYVDFVEQSTCSDIANGVAWGFVFFVLLAISTMVLVTLRSSWLHETLEEKIYDESEVDENMIVDEHEEYLAYISKYKHEWEEYQGLDAGIAQDGTTGKEATDNDMTFESTGPPYLSESEASHADSQSARWGEYDPSVSKGQKFSQEDLESNSVLTQEPFDPYCASDSQSQCTQASSDISFLSLQTLNDKNEVSFKKFGQSLPPLLVPSDSLEGTEDEDFVFRFPPTSTPSSYGKESTVDFQESLDSSIYESSRDIKVAPKPLNVSLSQKT